MQSLSEPAASSVSVSDSATFAGFLSALAAPPPAASTAPAASIWNDDALADDVATLSYESALKAHSRYKPPCEPTAPEALAGASQRSMPIGPIDNSQTCPGAETQQAATGAGQPKSASITIRMSQAECAQLKERAAEAGMTISAYLRSCTFEAEALRAQVKEVLAQLRAGTAQAAPAASPTHQVARRGKFDWLPRFFPCHQTQELARR